MLIDRDTYIVFDCPHCGELTLVYKKEINCQIFRHAIYKNSYNQVNPHLNKKLCEYLSRNGLIYGCSKPFKIIISGNSYKVEKCDYI